MDQIIKAYEEQRRERLMDSIAEYLDEGEHHTAVSSFLADLDSILTELAEHHKKTLERHSALRNRIGLYPQTK